MTGELKPRWLVLRQPGWFGVRVGRLYVSARSSDHRPLFSERNRIRCRVLALPRGWRIVARLDAPV